MATPLRVSRAIQRRVVAAKKRDIDIRWFIDNVSDTVAFTMKQRMQKSIELLHSRVVQNISRPVTKTTGPKGGKVVTNRSKPGEYPKVDTGQLLKNIMSGVRTPRRGVVEGWVATPLGYGAILEKWPKIDRKYMGRTLSENNLVIARILIGPII